MAGLEREEKLRLIRDHERKLAHSLALLVMDKPSPPFWMTFVPMFLVFLTQKFRQYESDVRNFASSYLESREHAIMVATQGRDGVCVPADAWAFLHKLDMPGRSKGIYEQYINMLASHYAAILETDGSCLDEMTRLGYAGRSAFERFCAELNAVEGELNLSLLPQINEDRNILLHVVQRMNDGVARLRRQEVERIFADREAGP
jgi:hypothetical protein